MILSVKNRFVCILLLLGLTLPATGQVYTTSKAKVRSVSTSGVGYDSWGDNGNYGVKYGPSSSFRSTSSYISSGPSYSVSVPSVSVKTAFSTSATAITGGVTLADDMGLDKGGVLAPNRVPGVPSAAPIGDIPWIVMALAAIVFVIIKKRKFE